MNKQILMMLSAIMVILVGVGMMKCRMNSPMYGMNNSGTDLSVFNDTSSNCSIAFMRDKKTVSYVVHPGERGTGGQGVLRVFVSDKPGNYEMQYQYPRPAGRPVEVSLSQILAAAHNPVLGDEIYAKKGHIEDIRVDYEEVRDME